jgi:dihydrodipicolinate synthase/N-acetylneuraminate lyase
VRLAQAAEAAGADLIQVSPPFYFAHTADDFYEYVLAAARASSVGIIVYNTFWTSLDVSAELLNRFADI